MSLDRDISLLGRVPVFTGLDTEQLRLLAFSAVRLELAQGQMLFREGAKAMSGYIVASGRLELSTRDENKRTVLAYCDPGCLVGEMALFIETKRPATATAVVPSEVLEIDRKLVGRMLNEYPEVALRIRTILAERLTAEASELAKVRKALLDLGRKPAKS
jgi:CRP-like cAMP-binding protein